jgi:hypothetical protein
VLGFVPVLGSLLLIPPLVHFLVLANSLKAASMEIAAAKLGPAAGVEVGGGGPPGGAGVGVLGAAGIVQGGSAGFGVAEKLTAPQDDRTGTG